MARGPKPISMEVRLWRRVEKRDDGCWIWTGHKRFGYGRMSTDNNGPLRDTHRIAYELLVGPIPEGLTIDHLCRNRACCNPAHLEPVTTRENTLRGESPAARAARRTHCIHGHEYTPENTMTYNGARQCRVCSRASQCRAYARKVASQ